MSESAFIYGGQQEYMIGAKRTVKAFRKALMLSIQDENLGYRQLFNKSFEHILRKQVRRLSEAHVVLNALGHAWDYSIPSEKIDSLFLFYEALNLLLVSCKNLQIGATLAAYAVQRQALEIATVGYWISGDAARWKEFKDAKKYDSTKCITYAKQILPDIGKVYGRLSNQAVHVSRGHIGKSITKELSEGGVRVAIGSHFHPSNADLTWIAMLDLLELSCFVEGLAEYSFKDYTFNFKYWRKGKSKSEYSWLPNGTVKEDFDYIESERKKFNNPLHHLNRNIEDNDRKAFEEVFSDFAIHDLDDLTKLQTALSSFPNSEIVFYFLGFYYEKHGDLNEAISWYEKATNKKNVFGGIERLARLYEKTGKIEKCIETHKKLIQIEPDNGAAYNNLGELLYRLGLSIEALNVLKHAIQHEVNNEIRLFNYANALLNNKQYDEAIAVYEKVANLNKHDPKPWHSRGVALLHLGKLDEAYRSFRKAVVIDAGYIASWLNLGAVSQMRGQLKKAKMFFSYCLKLVPSNYIANRSLAFVYAEIGDTKLAKKHAKKTFKADQGDFAIKKLLKELRRKK